MLVPRTSSAFVCLRCELKLARPHTATPRQRPLHSSFSSSARRHDGADEAETLASVETPAHADASSRPAHEVRISKEYMRKGKIVRQRKAKLGMKRMDEDADILVLNEATKAEHSEQQQPGPIEPISVPDILSSLQQDSAPATQEDVKKQLESLRPARANPEEPNYVTTVDFVKLVAALTRGFTTTQLSHYYSSAKSIKQDTLYKVVKATVKATKRSEWHPTTTDIKKRLPGVETINKPKQKTKSIRKATLVDKILRDVWKLELLEELEAPGELELRLKEWELKLLQTGGNDSKLARIANIRGAKVEIHWPTNVLRITADKNSAEYTADDVEEALGKARTTSLDLKPWAARVNEARLLPNISLAASLPTDYVSSLTSTSIVAYNDYTLKIHGLDETSVAEAKRVLIRLLPYKESATRTIDTQRLDAAKHGSYLLPVFHESKSLDYSYRNLSLGRWALPVTYSADATATEGQETPRDKIKSNLEPEQNTNAIVNRVVSILQPPVDGTFTGSQSTSRNRQTGYWALEPEYKVSADFGQALFSLEHSDPNKVVEAASDASRSLFQPAIPGLGSLLASSEFQNLSRTETPALLYDFIPSPEQKHLESAVDPAFPKLHVQVRTGRDGNRPTIHKLSLGFRERIHDVLLPDQAADIRFYRYGRLRFSSKSHHDKNVEVWSESVRQNIESGGRLTAPSLTIEIPKWTIPGFPSDAVGMVPVKYLFSSIQFRQSVTGRLLDTQISYSTVQSGKLGAKGGLLSAYSDKIKNNDFDAPIRDLATKCLQMVDYITQAGAQTQPLRHMRLPRNDYSARKQRRAELQEGTDHVLDQDQDSTQPSEASQDLSDQNNIDIDTEIDNNTEVYEETQTFLTNQEDDARLASRLDGDAPPVSSEDETLGEHLEEDLTEPDEDTKTAKIKAQEQQADALLDDLFGDEGEGEAAAGEEDEEDALGKEGARG